MRRNLRGTSRVQLDGDGNITTTVRVIGSCKVHQTGSMQGGYILTSGVSVGYGETFCKL
jgi:hypothetical protein